MISVIIESHMFVSIGIESVLNVYMSYIEYKKEKLDKRMERDS